MGRTQGSTSKKPPRPWLLPVEPFQRRIQQFVTEGRRMKVASGEVIETTDRDTGAYGHMTGCEPMLQLSTWSGVPDRSIHRYLSGHNRWIDFDAADKIICALDGPHLWYTDPELRSLYLSIDLARLGPAKPCCSEDLEEREQAREGRFRPLEVAA